MAEGRLAGKVAIVTGASRGIGRAVAERFAVEGAAVVVNYTAGSKNAAAVVAGIEAAGGTAIDVQADVSRSADVRRLVERTLERFGRVDILVNNAGVMVAKGVLETTEDDWDVTIDVNLKGAYLCSKEVAPVMIRQGSGSIINM